MREASISFSWATLASGTSSSNPATSSRQSVSAVNAEAVREKRRTLAAFRGWLGREKGRAGGEPGLLRPFSLTDIDAVPPPASSDPVAKRHAAAVGPRPGHISPQLRLACEQLVLLPPVQRQIELGTPPR